MSLEKIATIHKSEVLIIGHGIAGVFAALTIKEKNPDIDILLVDKASTGWAGKANKGGCCQFTISPGHTAEEIVEFHVRNTGEFLNDQEAYLDFVKHTPLMIEWKSGELSFQEMSRDALSLLVVLMVRNGRHHGHSSVMNQIL